MSFVLLEEQIYRVLTFWHRYRGSKVKSSLGKERLEASDLIHEGDSESNTLLSENKFTLGTPL
jgi:hypothetical protein